MITGCEGPRRIAVGPVVGCIAVIMCLLPAASRAERQRVDLGAVSAAHWVNGNAYLSVALPSNLGLANGEKVREALLELKTTWARPGLCIVAVPITSDSVGAGAADMTIADAVARFSSLAMATSVPAGGGHVTLSLGRLLRAIEEEGFSADGVLLGIRAGEGVVRRWPAEALAELGPDWKCSLTLFTTTPD